MIYSLKGGENVKKLLSVILACVLLTWCFAPANVSAAIMWTNINYFDVNLDHQNYMGIVTVGISTVDSSATIELSAKVYVKATSGKWIEITPDDWTTITSTGTNLDYEFYYDGYSNIRHKVDYRNSIFME